MAQNSPMASCVTCNKSQTPNVFFCFPLSHFTEALLAVLLFLEHTEHTAASGSGICCSLYLEWGFPGGTSGKEPFGQCRRQKRCRFSQWVGKIPWMKAWQPTPVFLPVEFHGQRSLVGYSPWGRQESDTTKVIEHLHYVEYSSSR